VGVIDLFIMKIILKVQW